MSFAENPTVSKNLPSSVLQVCSLTNYTYTIIYRELKTGPLPTHSNILHCPLHYTFCYVYIMCSLCFLCMK